MSHSQRQLSAKHHIHEIVKKKKAQTISLNSQDLDVLHGSKGAVRKLTKFVSLFPLKANHHIL